MKVIFSNSLPSLVKKFFLVFALLSFGLASVNAQETDTVKTVKVQEKKKKEKKEKSPQELLAQRAALKSAIIPGWGQFQNGGKHRWKIPVIYGGLGTITYFTSINHRLFKCYENAYIKVSQGEFAECEGFTTQSQLKDGMETYHQQRDMFVLITLGAYALNVLDAYVWAHLQDFDNSDDLTLNIYPSFINIADRQYAGFTVQLKL